MAGAIGVADTGQASQPSAASLDIQLSVSGTAVQTTVRMYGPGDVTSIDPRLIVRTEPTALANDFEPNYLAAIEFSQPDLPWLFTPLSAGAGNHLRPWIFLVVVANTDAVTFTTGGSGPAVLTVADPAGQLPDLTDSWAWAHAQVSWAPDPAATSDQLDAELLALLAQGSGQAISRLICPTQLQPGTRYHACVVPAFEAGREAGLGLPVTITDLTPAWTIPAAGATAGPVTLPVYYHWEFATGPAGDFESLVMPLWQQAQGQQAQGAAGSATGTGSPMSTEQLDVSQLASSANQVAPGTTVDLEGALSQDGFTPATLAAAVQGAVLGMLAPPSASGQPPVVAPPVYGDWYAARPAPPALDNIPPGWLWQLNLDPRYRVAAGLGVLVVQNQAEQLVAAAWDQLSQIQQANQALAQAQLARSASAVIHEVHLSPLPGGALLQVTSPVHAQVTNSPNTLAALIADSLLPDGVVTPAFRRIIRPQGPLVRRLAGGAPGQVLSFVDGLNHGTLQVADARGMPDGTVSMAVVSQVGFRGPGEVTDVTADDLRSAHGWALPPTPPASGTSSLPSSPTGPSTGPTTPTGPTGFTGTPTGFTGTPAGSTGTPTSSTGTPAGSLTGSGGPTIPLSGSDVTWGGDPADADIPTPPRFSTLSSTDFATMSANFRQAAQAHQSYLASALALASGPTPGFPLTTAPKQILAQIDPAVTVPVATQQRLQLPATTAWQRPDPLDPVRDTPLVSYPMFRPLADMAPDLMLPGVAGVPPDSATRLLANPRFLEAYLIGANHEMSRQLLWRGFPTVPLATYFTAFWGAGPDGADILPIAGWDPSQPLGANSLSLTAPPLVLMIRSAVFRRYPTASVYAVKAVLSGGSRVPGDEERYWLFTGSFEPDISYFGFDLSLDGALGTADGLGWFFVIQQHVTEPRFGLGPDGTAPAGSDAAQVATNLLQQPVRVAIHATALLGGTHG